MTALNCVFESELSRDRRSAVLRHLFPVGKDTVWPGEPEAEDEDEASGPSAPPTLMGSPLLPLGLDIPLRLLSGDLEEEPAEEPVGGLEAMANLSPLASLAPFDPDFYDAVGQSLWCGELTVEMNP